MKKLFLFFMIILILVTGFAFAQESREAVKIEYLISSVETLKEAKFIRNGRVYDAKKAADHLRLKLKAAGDRVKTAEDFVRLCASKSSISGRAYEIQFSDGSFIKSGDFFRNKLKEYADLRFHP